MANSKQATKRARQAEKHHLRNRWQKTRMFTHIKRVLKSIEANDHTQSMTEYRLAVSIIDRMVSKGLIHKNKAARHKSRLNSKVKAIAPTS